MKQYTYKLTSFLLILFVSCTTHRQDKSKIPPMTHSVSLGGIHTCDTAEYIFIKSSLINNSEDTLLCFSMTCSGDGAYKIDSKDLSLEKNICYSNVPMLIKVAPHKSFDYYLRLLTAQKGINFREVNFRLGYNLVLRDTTKDLSSQVDQIGDMKNVIWSDTVHLKDFWMRYDTQ